MHDVGAAPLDAIHRHIGPADQIVDQIVGPERLTPDRHAHGYGRVFEIEFAAFQPVLHGSGALGAIAPGTLDQGDREFIAAEPAADINFAHRILQHVRRVTQHGVARRVTEIVVHGFQIIQIAI